MPLMSRALPSVLVIALAAGCTSAGASTGVAARDWAGSVCVALAPWRAQIASLTSQAQQQITSASTPEQAKQSLVAMLAGVQEASEAARRKVVESGTPDVANGDQIAAGFVASLTRARDAYANARTTVAALDTTNAKAFYDGVAAAFERLNSEYATSALDTGKLGSAELEKAFAEVPQCK